MQSTFKIEKNYKVIKRWLLFFMIMLFMSGITAMPAEWELSIANKFFDENNFMGSWLYKIYVAIENTNERYPFLFYGYDWLAFGHVVLAILFIDPYRDPVKNKWVIEFGAIACLLVIPFWWRLIDCSFGILGLIPLGICYNKINEIEKLSRQNSAYEN